MTEFDDTIVHGSDLRDAGTADPPPDFTCDPELADLDAVAERAPENREARKLRDLGHLPGPDHPCFDPSLVFVMSATRGVAPAEVDDFVAEEVRACPGGADTCIMHVQTTKIATSPHRDLVTVSFYRRRAAE